MFNSLTFKYKVPYKLRPFNHCRLLNDSVKAASLMIRKVNYDSCQNIELEPINFRVIPDEIVYEKFENRNCFSCFPAIRKWKYWVMKPEHYFTKKVPCYKSYNSKYTSILYLMTKEEIEITKKDLIIYLADLIAEHHYMQNKIGIFNNYQVKRAEYLIEQQQKTKNQLKNLLGQEEYDKIMTKGEMINYIKQIKNEDKREI